MRIGRCNLCLEEKELVKSHIFPKFMYNNSMFDEKHRLRAVQNKNLFLGKIKYPQTGFWDRDILCKKCDNDILSYYEDYGSFILNGSKNNAKWLIPQVTLEKDDENFSFLRLSNVDYNLYKCFLLSLIWRASINKTDAFKKINLGDIHNERIRKMLFSGNGGDDREYEVIVTNVSATEPSLANIVTSGLTHRLTSGARMVSLYIGGFGYFYSISAVGHRTPELFNLCAPKKTNTASVLAFKSTQGQKIILEKSGLGVFTSILK